MKLELLSPAGNYESLVMAVQNGCDAVYLGGKKFGARAFSSNFSRDELKKAIDYCHLYGVKVYATVNTIIYDEEVDEFLDYIEYIYKLGIDAILLQDFGMIDLIHQKFPNLELHASTQMNIHTVEELKIIKEMGFKRAVLAREVDLNTIRKMKKEVDIELEVFVHGALCVSASGQCLMSYMVGGRSANRGECAGCCRQPYKLFKDNKEIKLTDKYLLSTKDLCLIDKIKELKEIGVDSLKIEGRMKSKEYVAYTTKAYRKAIDSLNYEKDKNNMLKMFNRGYTLGHIYDVKRKDFINGFRPNHMGYLIGKVVENKNGFISIKLFDNISQFDGIRFIMDEDFGLILNKIYKNNLLVNSAKKNEIIDLKIRKKIKCGTKVYKTLDKQLVDDINNEKNKRKICLYGNFYIKNKNIVFEINDRKNQIKIIKENTVEKSNNISTSISDIRKKLEKLGDTPFIFKKLDINIENNIFIPISIINNLRREAIDLITKERIKVNKIIKREYSYESENYNKKFSYIFEVENENQLKYILDNTIYNCYISDYNLYKKYNNNDRVIFKDSRICPINIDKSLVGEISTVKEGRISDTYFNVTNSYAVNFLHKKGIKRVTLSYELSVEKIKNLYVAYEKNYNAKPNLEVVIYGKPEVMVSKYCLLNTYLNTSDLCNICKKGNYYLVDKFNNKYQIKKSNDCFMRILDYKNINLMNKINELKSIGINSLRLVLNNEREKELENIINMI